MNFKFNQLIHNTRTKFAFDITDDLFYLNDKLLDFSNENDVLTFVDYLHELQLLNASTLIADLNLTKKQINFLNIANEIANVNERNLALYLNTLKITFYVDKIYHKSNVFLDNETFFVYYKVPKKGEILNNSILISSNYQNEEIFHSIKDNSYFFNLNKHTKFEIVNNDISNGILKVKSLQDTTFDINDEILFNNINLNYQIYQNDNNNLSNLLFHIEHYHANGIILYNDLTAQYVINVKKFLIANHLENIKVISCIHTLNSFNEINVLISNSDAIIYDRSTLAYYYSDFSYLFNVSYVAKACRLSNKPLLLKGDISFIRQDLYNINNDLYECGILAIDCFIHDKQYNNIHNLANDIKNLNKIINLSEQHFNYENNFEIIIKNSKTSTLKDFNFIQNLYDITKPQFINNIFSFKFDFIFINTNDFEFISALSNTKIPSNIYIITNDQNIINYFTYYYAINILYFASDDEEEIIKFMHAYLLKNKIFINLNNFDNYLYINRNFQIKTYFIKNLLKKD